LGLLEFFFAIDGLNQILDIDGNQAEDAAVLQTPRSREAGWDVMQSQHFIISPFESAVKRLRTEILELKFY